MVRSTIVGSIPGDWNGWYCSRILLLARPEAPPPAVSDEEPGDRGLSRLRARRVGGVVSASLVDAGGGLLAGGALSTGVLGAAPRRLEDSRGGGFAGTLPAVLEAPAEEPGAQLRGVRRLPVEGAAASELLTAAAAVADEALFPVDAAADAALLFAEALLLALE